MNYFWSSLNFSTIALVWQWLNSKRHTKFDEAPACLNPLTLAWVDSDLPCNPCTADVTSKVDSVPTGGEMMVTCRHRWQCNTHLAGCRRSQTPQLGWSGAAGGRHEQSAGVGGAPPKWFHSASPVLRSCRSAAAVEASVSGFADPNNCLHAIMHHTGRPLDQQACMSYNVQQPGPSMQVGIKAKHGYMHHFFTKMVTYSKMKCLVQGQSFAELPLPFRHD